MNKIVIIFTGGTISMLPDEQVGAAVPRLTGEDILKFVPECNNLADIIVDNFSSKPGPHMTPQDMWVLRTRVLKYLQQPEIRGVVVTHGTDTLEETAYLLDLTLPGDKPVVLVGAMRTSAELGWDGSANLLGALRTALHPAATNQGVLVVMHNQIFAAQEVTKMHTATLDTFQSPEFGPLGVIDDERVIFTRTFKNRQYIPAGKLEEKVDLIKCVSGMNAQFIDCSLANGAKGIVVEAMGRGNVPPAILPALSTAIASGVLVVVVSRCLMGRVSPAYGYAGAGISLLEAGVIFGGDLSGPKARIKLMVALGFTQQFPELKALFEG